MTSTAGLRLVCLRIRLHKTVRPRRNHCFDYYITPVVVLSGIRDLNWVKTYITWVISLDTMIFTRHIFLLSCVLCVCSAQMCGLKAHFTYRTCEVNSGYRRKYHNVTYNPLSQNFSFVKETITSGVSVYKEGSGPCYVDYTDRSQERGSAVMLALSRQFSRFSNLPKLNLIDMHTFYDANHSRGDIYMSQDMSIEVFANAQQEFDDIVRATLPNFFVQHGFQLDCWKISYNTSSYKSTAKIHNFSAYWVYIGNCSDSEGIGISREFCPKGWTKFDPTDDITCESGICYFIGVCAPSTCRINEIGPKCTQCEQGKFSLKIGPASISARECRSRPSAGLCATLIDFKLRVCDGSVSGLTKYVMDDVMDVECLDNGDASVTFDNFYGSVVAWQDRMLTLLNISNVANVSMRVLDIETGSRRLLEANKQTADTSVVAYVISGTPTVPQTTPTPKKDTFKPKLRDVLISVVVVLVICAIICCRINYTAESSVNENKAFVDFANTGAYAEVDTGPLLYGEDMNY